MGTIRLALCAAVFAIAAGQAQASMLVLKPDPSAGKDAEIASGALANLNRGTDISLITNWEDNLRSIGLIEFDLAAIPAGSTIHSATLSLFHAVNANHGQRYDVFRVTSAWNEATVSFDTAPSFDPAAAASLLISDSRAAQYRNWDITSLVQDWIDGTFANHGMWIEEIPIQGDGTAFFRSSDAPESQRPILTVDYEPRVSAVPEPASYATFAGALGLGLVGWLRSRRHAA